MKKFFWVLFLWGAMGSQSFGMMGEDDGSGAGPSRSRASAPHTTEDAPLTEEIPTPEPPRPLQLPQQSSPLKKRCIDS